MTTHKSPRMTHQSRLEYLVHTCDQMNSQLINQQTEVLGYEFEAGGSPSELCAYIVRTREMLQLTSDVAKEQISDLNHDRANSGRVSG